MTVEEGDHAVVQKIGRRDRRLAIIELGASNLGVDVDKGLLVDTPDPLQIANIERVLGAAVARMLASQIRHAPPSRSWPLPAQRAGPRSVPGLPGRSWPPVL